jgi:hypothetical protein
MLYLECKATLIEAMLGTGSGDREVHREYVASKAPDALSMEEEVASLGIPAVAEKTRTMFPRLDDGTPFIWDYQIKGFLKNAARALARAEGTEASRTKAYIKILTDCVFVCERRIPLKFDGDTGVIERPLRAQTPQGDRVALASSETVPAGTTFEFAIKLYDSKFEKLVLECLEYAKDQGFLQWRNSGYGRADIAVAKRK